MLAAARGVLAWTKDGMDEGSMQSVGFSSEGNSLGGGKTGMESTGLRPNPSMYSQAMEEEYSDYSGMQTRENDLDYSMHDGGKDKEYSANERDETNVNRYRLSKSQVNLVKYWPRIKKADDIAKRLKLRLAARISLYVPVNRRARDVLSGMSPAVKLEALSQGRDILGNIHSDSLNHVYTEIPSLYKKLRQYSPSRGQNKTNSTKSSSTQKKRLIQGIDGGAIEHQSE